MNTIAAHNINIDLIKVPVVITIYFWVIKILATTVGETGADYLNVNLHLGLSMTSVIMTALLILLLTAQIKSKRYLPWLYWLVVVMVSVVGTLITDNLTDNMGVPLELTTALFSIALLLTFWFWYRKEGSLSIHTIDNYSREYFYWCAILFTFALGTATGDLLAESFGLGYGLSIIIFATAIALITAAYFYVRLNAILAFWLVYILTRPLGASVGDYLSQPIQNGGLGFGTIMTSGIFLSGILALVIYLTVSRVDDPKCSQLIESNYPATETD